MLKKLSVSRYLFLKESFLTENLNPNSFSFLKHLLVHQLLKNGKKKLAQKIIEKAFSIIEIRTKQKSLLVLEKAIRNSSPKVKIQILKARKDTRTVPKQTPVLLSRFKSIKLAINWLITFSKKRGTKGGIASKLAAELTDAASGIGGSVGKKNEVHKMIGANKVSIISSF